MPPLKLFVVAAGALAMSGALLTEPYSKDPSLDATPATLLISRGHLVQKHYKTYAKRVEAYYESLVGALKVNAPDLLPVLESPKPPRRGFQILPKIIAAAKAPEPGPRPAQFAWYSWPWTDRLIDSGFMEVVFFQAELNRAALLTSAARRSIYEKLARGYPQIRAKQENIDAHIQYNDLWQTAIAANRAGYDRETSLYYAVLERQAILDALKAPNEAAVAMALAGFERADYTQSLAETKGGLLERERLLARIIHGATEALSTPTFVRVEHRGPGLWILHVPFYTDIADANFVRSVKESIEKIWRVSDGDDEFRVEVDIVFVPVEQLYPAGRRPPQKGQKIDAREHIALFPPDRAVFTTGALTTHVHGRAIILGPHDLTARVLAHEFGHILGFKDSYFRGYRDLGKNGFQVMEVVAELNDIMGAPVTGRVLRRHFERVLEHVAEDKSRRQVGGAPQDKMGSTDQKVL